MSLKQAIAEFESSKENMMSIIKGQRASIPLNSMSIGDEISFGPDGCTYYTIGAFSREFTKPNELYAAFRRTHPTITYIEALLLATESLNIEYQGRVWASGLI